MLLKSFGPNSYAWSDKLGATFDWCNRLQVNSTCDINRSHLLSGKSSDTPQRMDLKCTLNVCVVFYDKFLLCIPTGTNSHFIPFFSIDFLYYSDISLFKICFFGKNPPVFNLSIIFWYVSTIESSVLFFIGESNNLLPSISHIIMMDLCPSDYEIGNFSV